MFELIKSVNADNSEIVEFCDKQIAKIVAKASKVDSKKVGEQRAIMDMIIAVLCESDGKMKCGDIMKAVNAKNDTDFSLPKISAMLRKMLPPSEKNPDGSGEVVRIEDKKDTYFALAE